MFRDRASVSHRGFNGMTSSRLRSGLPMCLTTTRSGQLMNEDCRERLTAEATGELILGTPSAPTKFSMEQDVKRRDLQIFVREQGKLIGHLSPWCRQRFPAYFAYYLRLESSLSKEPQ